MSFELTTLGEYASIQGGYAYKSNEFTSNAAVPVLKIKNIRNGFVDYLDVSYVSHEAAEKTKKWLTQDGDVLISMTGSGPSAPDSLVGRVARTWPGEQKSLINQRVGRLIVKNEEKINKDFLYYFLSLKETQNYLVANSTGSANQVNIGNKTIENIPCPKISFEESKSIACFLNNFEIRLRNLRETNATLEAMAQALFKSWFVDFDPVHAKQQSRAPEGMDAATAALFPDSFEESELGLVPKGWKLLPFGECLSHTIGGDWGGDVPDESNDIRVAIIRGTDIPDLQACNESRVPVRFTTQKKLKSRELKAGDIVIEVSGGSKDQPTGRSILITEEVLARFDCPVEPASFCRLFRPSQTYLSYLLAQHLIFIYAQGKTWEYQNQSTGIANFQTTHFLEAELVALPADDVLKKFCEIVVPIVQQMNSPKIGQLANLRDTLLPRLISGQLRLPEAQALVKEAETL